MVKFRANRGGTLRIAARALLISAVSSATAALPSTVRAHNGILYCGTAPFAGSVFDYEWSTWDEYPATNYHVWNNGTYTQPCGYVW